MICFRGNWSRCRPSVLFLALLFCIAVLSGPALAETWYVTPNGTGDGTGWESASSDLAGVLESAGHEDEIWVAAGTYRPTENGSDRTASFTIGNSVAVYGGFAGTESSIDERDPSVNITVLTGDIDKNDSADEYGIVADADWVIGDNSYHVVRTDAAGINDEVILDGFTVTGGNADGEDDEYGGGMYNTDSSVRVRNCTFTGNSARRGGGIDNDNCFCVVSNCTFSGNWALFGGGIFNNGHKDENASLSVENCTFTGNRVDNSGGGLYNAFSPLEVKNCTFSGNSAEAAGGNDQYGHGGGLHTFDASTSSTEKPSIVQSCTFSGNIANTGGGMYSSDVSSVVRNCTFSGNNVHSGGSSSDDNLGGGIYLSGKGDSEPKVEFCTFTKNYDGNSNGFYSVGCTPDVKNSIFWDSRVGFSAGWKPVLSYCVVQGGYYPGSVRILTEDPLLGELADNGGPTWTCALGTGSSAIGKGLPLLSVTTDQRGVARPRYYNCDIGAYESVWYTVTVSADIGGTVSAEPYGVILSGDLTQASKNFTALDTPTFTITPEESMDLTGVWLDGASQDFTVASAEVTLEPLSADHLLEAAFKVKTFSITGTVSGDHGRITVSPVSVDWGDSSAVTVSADDHYHIDTLTVDGASHDFGTESKDYSITFEDVSEDHSVEAVFAIDRHTLGVRTGGTGTGTVTLNPAGGTYDYGTEVTLTAAADESSSFTGWSGNLTGSTNPATLTVYGDSSAIATFAIRSFSITAAAGAGGSVSPTSATVNWGGSATVTLTPSQHYAIADISVDGVSVGARSSYTFSNVRENHTLSASFAGGVKEPLFSAGEAVLDVIKNGEASVDLPAEMSSADLELVQSSDIGSFRLGEVHSGDAAGTAVSADVEGNFLCGVSFDVTALHDACTDILPVDLELVISEDMLSTKGLDAILDGEENVVGLVEAFLSRVAVLKVVSGDIFDLVDLALESGSGASDFFSVSRDEGNFLLGLRLLIVDGPAGEVPAVQAVPASGDCRFLIFDGAEDGYYRDPIVVAEKGDPDDGSGGCNALALSGVGLLLLPLLILLRKPFQ